jgi:RES domain
MPVPMPPARCPNSPRSQVVPAGTRLWRVHDAGYSPASFNPTQTDPHWGGGRFDSTKLCEPPYSYLYAAHDPGTALAETVMRDIPFSDRGHCPVPRRAIKGRMLSRIELVRDVTVLDLVRPDDFTGVCAKISLIRAEAAEYGQTRRWADWLRRNQMWAEGLRWQSNPSMTHLVLVFFGDRCDNGDAVRHVPGSSVALDAPEYLDELNEALRPYGGYVHPLRKRPGA